MAKITAEQVSLCGDRYLGEPYERVDCQALWELMLKAAGLTVNLAGGNAWWRAMSWTGTPEECRKTFGEIPKGACLFILKNDGGETARGYHDGKGNASHIGVYTGRSGAEMCRAKTENMPKDLAAAWLKKVNFGDGAIHASSTRACVATSKFAGKAIGGGWNRVGLWSRLSYGPKIDAKLAELCGEPAPLVVTGQPVATPTDLGEPMQSSPKDGGKISGAGMATVTVPRGNTVNVRERPNGPKVTALPVGTAVEVLSVDGKWARCRYETEGWIMREFLSEGVG